MGARSVSLRLLQVLLIIFWSVLPALADVTVVSLDLRHVRIIVSGPMDATVLQKFSAAIEDPLIQALKTDDYGHVLVELNSPGGSVPVSIALGELIRKEGMWTVVKDGAVCASSCVLILAAGAFRAALGKVGIHRPHFDEALFANLSQAEASAKYNEMADGVRLYLRKMGMADGLYVAMLRVASDEIQYLSGGQIDAYGLGGEDPAWAEWNRARYQKRRHRKIRV